ncbi:MAG TPA: hypothetical protein VFU36_05910 [Jatrophihabitans sp.]|nr:hypothetical protein [Jatrophihabitans sp.]
MSTLSDYLNAHLPSHWQKPQVVEALRGVVDRATVYRYLSGRHPRTPSDAVLRAFASVLPGTSLLDLRAAARLGTGEEEEWIPPREANRLNPGQRRALEAFIRATVNEQYEPEDEPAIEQPPVAEPVRLSAAARADVQTYIAELHASGLSDLASRVAATLAINSASDTANKSSSD